MTEMGMSALYLIRSEVVFNGNGSACHWDFVRCKRKVRLRFASIPASTRKRSFNLPDIRSGFGSRYSDDGFSVVPSGSADSFRVMITSSSDRSVVKTVAASGSGSAESAGMIVIISSSKRLSKSQTPESFWLEFSVPILDNVDCDPAGSIDNSPNLTGSSSWTVFVILMLSTLSLILLVLLSLPLPLFPPSET